MYSVIAGIIFSNKTFWISADVISLQNGILTASVGLAVSNSIASHAMPADGINATCGESMI